MSSLYSKPLRVYILLAVLGLWGVLSGLSLPISLFPKSSQAIIGVNLSYGQQTALQFYESYGSSIENRLRTVVVDQQPIDDVTAQYGENDVQFLVKFPWGADPETARKNVETTASTIAASLPEDIRRSLSVNPWRENSTFFAASFYSSERSLDELYRILDPLISQFQSKVPDSAGVGLYNPKKKELRVVLNPEKMALYQLSISSIEKQLQSSIVAMSGGQLNLGDKFYRLSLPKPAGSLDDFKRIPLGSSDQSSVALRDIADISITPSETIRQKFKTSGVESLILFANPKEGGNVKNMSEDIIRQLKILEGQLPKDIEYKVLVNPAEFINRSILGVIHEVGLAALLAVIVLFIFIGSLKNVITAAIEIPLSLVMAFILMKLTNMNLNLISLGGLALSAGMNVDASVVVMENIFRYFENHPGKKSPAERLELVLKAVNEVKGPILSSTVASLVVFVPLIFTRGLTNSLLGDLAKAVVFSHGLSALVALVLVPTVRLQLMRNETNLNFKSPFEPFFRTLESLYVRALDLFMASRRAQLLSLASILAAFAVLLTLVMPRLPKEIIGKPETDWLIVGFSSPSLSSLKQAEVELDALENDLLQEFGSDIMYTFSQVQGQRNGNVMIRLKDRSEIERLTKRAEEKYVNTPSMYYWVEAWNPSELQIPNPPDFRVELLGGSAQQRIQAGDELKLTLNETQLFPRVRTTPDVSKNTSIQVKVLTSSASASFPRQEVTTYLSTATQGRLVGDFFLDGDQLPIYFRIDKERTQTLEQLKALPVGLHNRVLPLSALAEFSFVPKDLPIYREGNESIVTLEGRVAEKDKKNVATLRKSAQEVVAKFREQQKDKPDAPIISVVDTDTEMNSALEQLKWAVAISILFIFITMVLQFGDVVHALLVLVAIPLGILGVLTSLFVFQSTLSLNSGLGTVLLNGIAVANSIILVDFMKRLFEQGYSARMAALEAAKARLRPILMTSLTTVLGMLPIALGMGDGGKILQPLGIAVVGGLWVSMLLTLFAVPTLQYLYLSRKKPAPAFQLSDQAFIEKQVQFTPEANA